MSVISFIRNNPAPGGALALLSLAAVQSAHAQVEAAQVEEVVIEGVRLQNRRAIEDKRDAASIVDVVTSDEVGALPDFSLAEALSRVTGVSFEDRNGDAEFLVVRGMRSDFNYLQLDGGIVPSTRTNGRATQTSIIPSYIVKKTEVVKSFSADMDGNAIGAQVAVQTRSAFDQDGTYFAARGALGFFDQSDSPAEPGLSNRGDMAFTTRFGTHDQFGVVLSGSYLRQDYDTFLPGVAFSEYDFFDTGGARHTELEEAAADATAVPHGAQMYLYNNEIERVGGFGKLEFAPNDRFHAALSAYQFEENETEERWDDLIFRNRRGNIPQELTGSSGVVEEGRVYRQYFLQGDTNRVRSLSLNSTWMPDERQHLDMLVVKADGERENPFHQIRFDSTTANEELFAYRYESSGKYPVLSLANPQVWSDATLFSPVFYRPRMDVNEQNAVQAKLDYSFNMRRAEGPGWKAGASFRTDERTQDQLYDNDFRPDTAETKAFTLDNALLDYTAGFEPSLVSGVPQYFVDNGAFLDFFNATSDQWGDRNDPDVEALSSQFEVSEDISAAYLMGRYAGASYALTAGLRYESTRVSSTGAQRLDDDDPSTPEYPIVSEDASYHNWLPSASLIWDVAEDWRLRAAYSRSLGRGEYSDLSVLGTRVVDDATQSISISSGNPALDPRVSDNFDLSFERYFNSANGALALAFFHKDIENEIFKRKSRQELTIDGVLYTLTETRPDNAHSASVSGVELGITFNSLGALHPALEDFGFSGNYAHFDSKLEIEMDDGSLREVYGLIRQPKNIANLSVFWSPGDFELRAAFAYSDENLESTSTSSPTYDEYIGPRERLDVQARYKLGRNFGLPGRITAFAEVRNLTGKGIDQNLSYGPTHYTRDFGRSGWLGLIWKY